ncbi:MAG TPA: DUF5658 family protein [Thermoleophilia bacterium]|nr:DUF5658 family protein [Thermoleophilia bacterium]
MPRGVPIAATIVIDRGLYGEASALAGDGFVVDRRRCERRQRPGAGGRRRGERRRWPAPFVSREAGALLLRYVCPHCGTRHSVLYERGFARSYAAALPDGDCLCPGKTNWLVSRGIKPRPVLVAALIALWLLNLWDLVLTRHALQSGLASEANSLMNALLGVGWLPAIVFKIGVVSLGVVVLWKYRHHRLAVSATVALMVFYCFVVLYQAVFIARLT